MKNKNQKTGFTLAEVLTTLSIIGVVAAIGIPMVMSKRPNNELVLCKKAYYTVERIVSELVNDEDFYPQSRQDSLTLIGAPANGSSTCAAGDGKFCCLFAEKLNIRGAAPTCTEGDNSVRASDGITYTLPITSFNAEASISVDTNPNGVGSDASPDTFTFVVEPSGRIRVDDANAQAYLNTRDVTARTVAEAQEN